MFWAHCHAAVSRGVSAWAHPVSANTVAGHLRDTVGSSDTNTERSIINQVSATGPLSTWGEGLGRMPSGGTFVKNCVDYHLGYICKHFPGICYGKPFIFRVDEIHLFTEGTDIYLANMTAGTKAFLVYLWKNDQSKTG